MIIVGIDPGHNGGAVCLVDGVARHAWRWRRYGRKRPPSYVVSGEPGTRRLHCVIEGIVDLAETHRPHVIGIASVEGLFVHRDRTNGVLELAETTGKVLGVLEAYVDTIVRPLASEWRPRVLGLRGNVASDLAESTAVAALNAKRGIVEGWTANIPAELRRDPHVCEAACIARFAMVTA